MKQQDTPSAFTALAGLEQEKRSRPKAGKINKETHTNDSGKSKRKNQRIKKIIKKKLQINMYFILISVHHNVYMQ